MTENTQINALYVTKVGSVLYGTDTPQSDIDFKGFCLPTYSQLVGLDTFEQQQYCNDVEDGPDKMEGVVYSLKKFFHNAIVKANPTILEVCFADAIFHLASTQLGLEIAEFIRENSVTKRLFKPYNAYHLSQIRKLQSQTRVGKRKEIVDEYGYDLKFACHAYRLGVQATQAMAYGKIIPTLEGEYLDNAIKIRSGDFSKEEVLKILEQVDKEMYEAYKISTIPDAPDYNKCNDFLTRIHINYLSGKYPEIERWSPW